MILTIKPFKINDLLEVKFEGDESVIYVDSAPFRICKYLFLIDPQNHPSQAKINSIDEAKEALNGNLEDEDITPEILGISKAEMFWGHCSNLQAWWEYDYDTRVLHSNLSFPLLKELTKAGDVKAKLVFKEEVAKRFLDGYLPVILFLIEGEYLDYLELEEKEEIVEILADTYHDRIESLYRIERAFLLVELCVYYIEKQNLNNVRVYTCDMRLLGNHESFAELWVRIGRKFLLMREDKKALEAFDRAIESSTEYETAWFYRGLCYAYIDPSCDSGYQEAINTANRAIELEERNFAIWEILGGIYEEAGEFEKAASLFYSAILCDWNNSDAWYKLGHCLIEIKNISGARRAYKLALKDDEFQQLSEDEQLRIKNNERKLMDFGYFTLLPYLKKDDPLLSFLKELDDLDLSDKAMLF